MSRPLVQKISRQTPRSFFIPVVLSIICNVTFNGRLKRAW